VPKESTFEPAHVGAPAHAIGAAVAPAPVAHHEVPPPPQWVEVPDEPASDLTTRIAACVLFVLCGATFFLPWGWITALRIGVQKGVPSGYCYAPGCTRLAETRVAYRDRSSDSSSVSEDLGYCNDHAAKPVKDVTRLKQKNVKSLLAFLLIAGGIAYCLWYVVLLLGVFGGEKNAFRNLALMSLVGVVGLNLLSYFFWIWLCPVMHF
jgi:hypothetical protein